MRPALEAAVDFAAWGYNVTSPPTGPPYTAAGGDGGFHAFGCVQAAATNADASTFWAASDDTRDREAAAAAWDG